MKHLVSVLFLALVLLMSSCGSDDNCLADDWVGTWSGLLDCNDPDLSEEITLIVTRVDDNTLLFDDGSDVYEMPITGCNLSLNDIQDSFLGEVEVDLQTKLDGDNMDWDISVTLFGISVDCSSTLTRN